jgi:hypothetical protein
MISVGPCPVCAGAGAVIVVARADIGTLFFACPSCGCAWAEPPRPPLVDTVDAPAHFAPAGFRLAPKDEVLTSGLGGLETEWRAQRSHAGFEAIEGFVAARERSE